MRKNKLRELWDGGQHTVNGWCGIPCSFSAEVMAQAGWESVTVDMQHGLVGYQASVGMLQAISTTDAVPLVRVPWRDAGSIMKALDAGAYGIICPMVNNPAEAAEFVSYCKYPPLGGRSFGPIRASIYGGSDYPSHANDETLAIAMIETAEALENVEAIVATEGLDGVYVGPADLAASLGKTPGMDPTDETVVAAITKIITATKKAGLYAGIHCGSPAYSRKMWEAGFDFASIQSDTRLLAAKAAELIAETRQSGKGGPASGSPY